MMNSYLFVITVLTILFSFDVSASKATVRWVGKVPTLDCASNPVSNQTNVEELKTKCHSEFISSTRPKELTKISIISFNI